MANSTAAERRTIRPVTASEPRPETRLDSRSPSEPQKKPKLLRANELVRAIGLPPITGSSGPKLWY
ncbi:hypothetical protein [Paracoccus tibetensis]|uniref:Uncharacterized protein n=1 Tax=Paracoccus tibetensis TaxID=336292 RepID=A0A1G5H7F1_9RHOB|nr:hypothetical protein [Paracoccus tibetensis]SCY59439.1 hypothetical protein SAMN05660710_02016 [Paracoccus tibetensis]